MHLVQFFFSFHGLDPLTCSNFESASETMKLPYYWHDFGREIGRVRVEILFIQVPSSIWTHDPSDGGIERRVVHETAQMSFVTVGNTVKNIRGMVKWHGRGLV
jgi:hypothetical protein